MRIKSTFILLAAVIIFSGCSSYENKGGIDAKERFSANIVPQPKIVTAAENAGMLEIFPEDIRIVYGDKSPKSHIGAVEINKQLYKMGFINRNIPVFPDSGYRRGKEKMLIVIGGASENILAKALPLSTRMEEGLKSISNNPEGYVIDYIERDNDIPVLLIAGTSPQGTLYGAVTLMQMFGKNNDKLLIPPVFVKDWPDFRWRFIGSMHDFTMQSERAYKFANLPYVGNMAASKEYVDWALRYKINVIRIIPEWLGEKLMKELIPYLESRGIQTFSFYSKPSIAAGTVEDKKNNPEKYSGLENLYRNNYYLTWSRDDLLEPQYREFAKKCKTDNIGFCWFHTADSGLLSLNYAQWRQRDNSDKEKFGDNYGLADSHVIGLIRKVFKEESPATRIVYVTYPYTAIVLDDKFPANIIPDMSGVYAEQAKLFIDKYFTTFSRDVPSDIYTCLRETSRDNVNRWLEATQHNMLIYFEESWPGYDIVNSRARYIKTFYSDRYDNIYFLPSIESGFIYGIESPGKILLHAEYSWNKEQVGADYFKKYDFNSDLAEPSVVFEKIIPRICRAYWGESAGKNFEALFQTGIVPGFIEDPVQFQKYIKHISSSGMSIAGNDIAPSGTQIFFDDPIGEMKRQNGKLQKAIPSLEKWIDSYNDKKLDPFSYKYGVMLYLFAYYWYYKSSVWSPFLEIENSIAKGEKEKAEKKLAEANEILNASCRGMTAAVEKIKGKHPCLMPLKRRIPVYKEMLNEFERLKEKYEELKTKTSTISKSQLINKEQLDLLKNRKYRALCKNGSFWENCPAYSDFILLKETMGQAAFFQTKVQIMYDDTNIYFRIVMEDLQGKIPLNTSKNNSASDFWSKDHEANTIEIFISPETGCFYQFVCDTAKRKLQFYGDGKKTKNIECDWTSDVSLGKGFWRCNVNIPWASLKTTPAKINSSLKIGIMRQVINTLGVTEISVISPEMKPGIPESYPEIIFEK